MKDILEAELVMGGKKVSSVNTVAELQNLLNVELDERIIKTRKGSAEIYIKEDTVCISSKGKNGVAVHSNGVLIDGDRIHLATEPHQIRINGFWVLNDELLTTLPSTIYTPISTLVYSEPMAAEEIQNYMRFLNGIG